MLSEREVFEIYQHNLEISCGRSLCIVGGGYKGDEDLERFDHVCWVNNHWQEGEPIHSVFTSSSLKPKDFPLLEFAAYQGRLTYVEEYESLSCEVLMPYECQGCQGVHVEGLISECMSSFNRMLNTSPLTGIKAIYWFNRFPWQSIHITGMDFYNELLGGVPFKVGPHELKPQVEWLSALVRNDLRYSVHPTLAAVLSTAPKPRRRLIVAPEIETNGVSVCWSPVITEFDGIS